MMNTILNLGLNDETIEGLAAKTGNPRFAYDCYRRFIQMFGEVALEHRDGEVRPVFDARKHKVKAKLDTDLTADDLKAIIDEYKKIVKKETASAISRRTPREQLAAVARRRVQFAGGTPKASYYRKMEKISERHRHRRPTCRRWCSATWATTSGTGVGFTRDPGSGEKVFYGEFLVNAQGEDVVAGIRTPQPISELEDVECPTSTASCARSPRTSKSTTRTCRISSSPCRKASCTCCRPATASARVRRPFASRWTWWREG